MYPLRLANETSFSITSIVLSGSREGAAHHKARQYIAPGHPIVGVQMVDLLRTGEDAKKMDGVLKATVEALGQTHPLYKAYLSHW